MRVIENAVIIGRSFGENNVYVVENENTGKKIRVIDLKGYDLEVGTEGRLEYLRGAVNHLISFEPAMVEEFV